ncbi:hypothetical protein LMG22037_04116 [Paraburkholderia phenoliruptrix]|uniref:Lipoprotein n=1 Tax=Paraburkholderia phenoliruptrix TaxID=252970 RepID=A0A6J5BMJ0_9BURK|nr:hypothetical protein [Paraburkholderia phenoliruptrix]CAB3711964.1 hypothetical protein LMG22037_04116 [Paraburkholderia phenoliruptrix]
MFKRGIVLVFMALGLLAAGCATVVSDDYSPEFSGDFTVTDNSGDQTLNQKVLKITLHDGSGNVIAVGSDRPEVWLTRCRSQIGSFGHSDDGHEIHEMWCLGSDRFSYLFVHGKPGLEVPEALMMKMFKDRHDVKSGSGYVLRRYIPNMITVTYALERQVPRD